MLTTVRQDVRFALRKFRRSPGFAVTVVVTLALGIGATTAIFSLVDGILLRPLPLPRAERLVAIDTLEFPPGGDTSNPAAGYFTETSYPDSFDWKRQNQTFASLASYDATTRLFSKAGGENAQVIACGQGRCSPRWEWLRRCGPRIWSHCGRSGSSSHNPARDAG